MVSTTMTNRTQAITRLSSTVPLIFNDAQNPNAVLLRFSVSLRKIQELCSLNEPIVPGELQDINYEGEEAFHKEFIRNLNKALPIRRKEAHADNIVRFVATFLQHTQKQDQAMYCKEENDEELENVEETISSRFVRALLMYILNGFTTTITSVRIRCCQIIALSVSCLSELDEDLYMDLKTALFQRIKDKEDAVRVQAVTALLRLQRADEEPDSVDGLTITQKLSLILRHDTSAEVRRAILLNLVVDKDTIPYIIERARDVDTLNRRLVYSRPLSEISDFRNIPSEIRYKVIKWGLSDRDTKVRSAAVKMIAESWIEQANHNLLEFLERMDIMEGMEGGVSEKMLVCVLENRMKSMSVKFDDQFWNNLSPESAFLARVYTSVLHSNKMDEKLDEIVPEVTRHAFYIHKYNDLWQQSSRETEGEYEFIVAQLLGVAKKLDYADEAGRREMYSILREVILVPDLPDDHLESLVDLISLISMNECDFTRIIVDVISDIQEQASVDDRDLVENSAKRLKLEDESAIKPEQAGETDPRILQMKLAKLKCLIICKFMLERCEQSLQENTTIYGLLNQLVIPAVQSKEVIIREEGLHCLGLICHLDKEIAIHNLTLFELCIRSGHEGVKKKALMIFFDLIMKFGYSAVSEKIPNTPELFEYSLDNESSEIQCIASEGLTKLILSRAYKNEETLKLLILLYFFPNMADNNKLQQCLSYFFPAYCHSNTENQQIIAKLAVQSLEHLVTTYLDLQDDEKMVAPNTIADMLTHWTDPRPIVAYRGSSDEVDMAVHGKMAIHILDVLRGLMATDTVLRKVMCHMLSKLYLDDIDQETLTTIINLSNIIDNERPILESLSRKQVQKVIRHLETLKADAGETNTTEDNPASTRASSVSTTVTTTTNITTEGPSAPTELSSTQASPEPSPSLEASTSISAHSTSIQQSQPTLPGTNDQDSDSGQSSYSDSDSDSSD